MIVDLILCSQETLVLFYSLGLNYTSIEFDLKQSAIAIDQYGTGLCLGSMLSGQLPS
jgi:hypothetical protein